MTSPTLFKDMSDAEKGALLLAEREGKAVECYDDNKGWLDIPHPLFFATNAYRVKPETTTVVCRVSYDPQKQLLWDGPRYGGNFTNLKITLTLIDGVIQPSEAVEVVS